MTPNIADALNMILLAAMTMRKQWPDTDAADHVDQARATLAAHIAAQDAEIARMREALKDALQGDLRTARATLNQGEGK